MGRYQCRKEAARRFTPPKPTTKSEIRAGNVQFRTDKDNDRAGEIVTELSPTLDAKALLEVGRGMVVKELNHEKVVEKQTKVDEGKYEHDFNSEEGD